MLGDLKGLLKRTILYKVYRKLKLHEVIRAPRILILSLEGKWFPVYKAKRMYKKKMGKKLNLENPQTLTDKLNWLKLFHLPKDPSSILAGDKWGLHTFLKERGLSRLASPILYVFDSAQEICWESLPNKFVIKKSNASGYNIMITNKNNADEEEVKNIMKYWMKMPFGYMWGNTFYEKMQSKIIIEEYIENMSRDWRLFCVNGKPEILCMNHWVGEDETHVKEGHLERGIVFTDLKGEILDFTDFGIEEVRKKYKVGEMLELPADFGEMIELSKILSKDFPFVRADFYHGDDRLILGELTFVPGGGFSPYVENIRNNDLGRKLILPKELDN